MVEINLCGQKGAKKLNSVPLSARIVKERISILAENVKEHVIFTLKQAKYFAIQLDKTTNFNSNLQLIFNACSTATPCPSSSMHLKHGISIMNKRGEFSRLKICVYVDFYPLDSEDNERAY